MAYKVSIQGKDTAVLTSIATEVILRVTQNHKLLSISTT